ARKREQEPLPSRERRLDSDQRRPGGPCVDGERVGPEGVAGARERRARARDRAPGRRAGGRVPGAAPTRRRRCRHAGPCEDALPPPRRRPSAFAGHRGRRNLDSRRFSYRSGRGRSGGARMSTTRTLSATVEALCGDLGSIRAPRGIELNARSWSTEAPLRMLLNNLDSEVAERPQDLVVYGGSGKAARNRAALP